MNLIADNVLERLFSRAAAVGCGIEINLGARDFTPREQESVLRFYCIAKRCGCKFYIGSDAHEAVDLRENPDIIRRAILALDLQETDKFHVASIGRE